MATNKKTSKKAKNKEESFEKQLDNIEKNLEITEKTYKKQKAINKKQKEREKSLEEKINIIKKDLQEQLFAQNKFGKQFDDMIEDYIFFVKLKEELQYDIQDNGIRYKSMTGNGYTTDKPNESVQNLIKVNAQMLKILQDLELKAPEDGPKEGGEDDLL